MNVLYIFGLGGIMKKQWGGKMEYNLRVSASIKNKAVIALFGYLIKCNNQVHSFQEKIINYYIGAAGINDESIVKSVVYDYEDAIPFEVALAAFLYEDKKTKNELYRFLVIVASIDGCIDSDEKVFLEKLQDFLDRETAIIIEEKARKKAVTLRKKLKKENAKGHTGRKANAQDNLFRIPQKEYVAAIDKCRKIARKDYEEILPVCESIIVKGRNFLAEIDLAMNSFNSGFHPEIRETVMGFAKSFEEIIIKKADEYNAQITQKATTLEDFTIALIGETKAGKTTLRSVLTGEGYDGIGAGKQRTTRVNHVYEWNNLRIIDTPGISAGSDFENKDKEIARKAIYEADLICYVTVTDGKFSETKEFITDILKSNKPVHILINYKNNLLDEFNYEDFIDDPTEWCRQDGKNTISGYFEPIRRIAVQNNVESLLSCSYVFLLAAWLSDDERYIQDSKILMKNSGLEEFLGKIKIIVTEQGSFLRSKTIIDDTIAVCESWHENLLESLQPVISCKESLETNRKEVERKLTNEKTQFSSDIKNIIKTQYKDLATRCARQFVEENMGCSKKELSNKWAKYCEKIEFNQKLENKLTDRFVEYSDSLREILDEVFDDINFDVKVGLKDVEIKKTVSPPFKEIFTFLGGGIGLIGSILTIALSSNPVGWILTGVGLVISLVSNLFKSKKEREKKEKDNLYNSLENSVMSSYEKNKDDIQKQLDLKAHELYAKVISTYDETQNGMCCVERAVVNIMSEIADNINKMNCIFAERIIEYITGSSKSVVQGVERKFGESMTIYLKKGVEYDTGKLKGLINEIVRIAEKE